MKRSAITCIVLVCFLVGSMLPVFVFSETGDWPMLLQNVEHTGTSRSVAPETNQTLWKFNTGGQVGSPLVVDGVVYVGAYDR